MMQLKYAIRDLKNYLKFYLVIAIQLLITFLLFAYSFSQILYLQNGMKDLQELAEKQSFVAYDDTSDDRVSVLFQNELETISKLQQIFTYLNSMDISYLLNWSYSFMLNEGGVTLRQQNVDQGFMDLYQLELIKGSLFKEADYGMRNEKPISVIVGYELQELYRYGEIYTFTDAGTGIEFEGEVVGILRKNSTYMDLNDFSEISLDRTYLIPFSMERLIQKGSVSDYDMALQSLVIISDDSRKIEELNEYIAGTETLSIQFVKMKEALQEFVNYMTPQIQYQVSIAIFILIFTIFGLISNLLLIINKNLVEYSIHIHCGAEMKDIVLRILLQVMIVMLISIFPVFLLYGISLITLAIVLIMMVLTIVVMPIVIVKLNSENMIQIVRRYE